MSLAPLEIRALAKIMDELDYYQILHLDDDAPQSAVKKAYFATSRTFHPDANRRLESDLREQCVRISKRVTEAYCVLRDPRRRRAYDAQRTTGGRLRLQLAEARAKESEQRGGKTAQGKQFHRKALADLSRGDAAAAVSNLQMALTFEPDNDFFKEQLEQAKKQL